MSALWDIEKSLLLGRWSASSSSPTSESSSRGHVLAEETVKCNFKDVLTSPEAQTLLHSTNISDADPLAHLAAAAEPEPTADAELARLAIAVSALHAFVQTNWTGPDLDFTPLSILSSPSTAAESTTEIQEIALNQHSIASLAYGGEPFYHLAKHTTFLHIALLLLARPLTHSVSGQWWKLRAARVQIHCLDEPVAFPPALLADFESEQSPLKSLVVEDPEMHGRMLLEQGLAHHATQGDKTAGMLFVGAARATGMEYELTGALGKRTKFQVNELSQLVLLAESRLEVPKTDEEDAKDDSSISTRDSEKSTHLPETLALNDDTLLESTVFTSSSSSPSSPSTSRLSHLSPSSQPPLHPLDQSSLLALCLNISNTSPLHGLTTEQMSPYITRVLSHPLNWTIHTIALLLRARLESSRTRTVERAVLQLQALVDQIPLAASREESVAPVQGRLEYFHALDAPSKWAMERELAKRYLSLGITKSALAIFERLEMWDDVVRCWQQLERGEKAVAIVKDLLEGRKDEAEHVAESRKDGVESGRREVRDKAREAKLYCILGDLEHDKSVEHYQHALSLSPATSARAHRSLGSYYFARAEYAEAIPHLEEAVRVNPLIGKMWFVLGCACAKVEDWEGGRRAFARCVSVDEEDGEAWSNLASMYLRLGAVEDGDETKKDLTPTTSPSAPVPYAHKHLAFRALQQGLKFAYDNWRMWSNYMIVAVDVGELAEAARAMRRVAEHTASTLSSGEGGEKRKGPVVDEDVLDRLVDAATRTFEEAGLATNGSGQYNAPLLKPVLSLIEDTLLPLTSAPRVFRAYARLLTAQGRWDEAIKAHLDAYRAEQTVKSEEEEGSTEKFREDVRRVEDVVDVLRNFGPRVDEEGEGKGGKWRGQARSLVRAFMARNKDFVDEPEWKGLEEMVEDLKRDVE